jgi:hypothetical protein
MPSRYHQLEVTVDQTDTEFRLHNTRHKAPHGFNADIFRELNVLRRSGSPNAYGKRLFEAFFPEGDLRNAIRAARMVPSSEGLRICLNIQHRPLESLWWECLRDENPPQPPLLIGRSDRTPLSRFVLHGAQRATVTGRLRVLVVIANPINLGEGDWRDFATLDEDAEQRAIDEAFNSEDLVGAISYEVLEHPATTGRINEALRKGGFHVLHLVAHGTADDDGGEFALVLEENDRSARLVQSDGFAEMFANLPNVKLVVLAACRSAWQPKERVFAGLGQRILDHGVPAVVAMQDPIDVDASKVFTQRFYAALGGGDSATVGMVDLAANQARAEIFVRYLMTADDRWDWAVPVTFLQGLGRLFKLPSIKQFEPDRSKRGALQGPSAPHTSVHRGASFEATDPSDERMRLLLQGQRIRLYSRIASEGIGDADLDFISQLYWETPFDQLPGDTREKRVLHLINRALSDQLDLDERITATVQQRAAGVPRVATQAAAAPAAPLSTLSELTGGAGES